MGSLGQQAFDRHEDVSQGELQLDWSRRFGPVEQIVGGDERSTLPDAHMLENEQLPIMRVIGQVGAAYIITEGPDGLFLIDQHAAHERILYEQFMAQWEQKEVVSQGLMAGSAVHLPPSQALLLEERLDTLIGLGFKVEPFGPNAFMVRAMPAIVSSIDPAKALMAVVEDLERGDVPLQEKIEDRIVLRVCKSAAIKAGKTLSQSEMEALVQQLEACQNPHTCPHGRPTLIHLSVAQLARQFGRT
jgi:DNA mismatch repair protein MutL